MQCGQCRAEMRLTESNIRWDRYDCDCGTTTWLNKEEPEILVDYRHFFWRHRLMDRENPPTWDQEEKYAYVFDPTFHNMLPDRWVAERHAKR